MDKEQMNKIVKAAQEQFDVAKNLILQEMQVALDEADHGNVCTDDELEKILDKFITTTTAQFGDDEYDGDQEDEGITWINEDAIDFDKDYNECGILLQKHDDGSSSVALEFDSEMTHEDVCALLIEALAEVLYDAVDYNDAIEKDDLDVAIAEGITNAIIKLAANKVIDLFK